MYKLYNERKFLTLKKINKGGDNMANVLDYIDWRGDLTFEQSPFNLVDNLILSCLSYVVMDGIVGGLDSANGVSVKELADSFEQLSKDEKICGTPRMRHCCYLWEKANGLEICSCAIMSSRLIIRPKNNLQQLP